MALDVTSYALSKGFTSESLLGGGAVVGKNVTISSITPIDGGNRVTFSYTLDDGTVKTSTMDVMDGANGEPGHDGKDFKYEDFTPEQLEALKIKGDAGIGISKIEKINTVGLVDTYRITYTDNTIFDYEIKNGANGSGEGASQWSEISDKPFESLSADFSVENGELKVVGDMNGKSAYQYAQEGGYTGTEEEFAVKLAMEYPRDVQINGNSVVDEDGVASIPFARNNTAGVVKTRSIYGLQPMPGLSDGTITIVKPTEINIKTRGNDGSAGYKAVSIDTIDFALKYTMTDGKGAAWTDTEKTGAWERLTSIKTAMDEVAVAGAHYYLPEQTELTITLPDGALPGQEIIVVWYNGETPAALAISGNMLDFDYVPGASSRSEISALWDGTYWSLISNEQSVPTTTEEVVASE